MKAIPINHHSKEKIILALAVSLACMCTLAILFFASPKLNPFRVFSAIAAPTNSSDPSQEIINVGPETSALAANLEKAGLDPVVKKSASRTSFSVKGTIITLKGDNIISFEYRGVQEAQADFAAVSEKLNSKKNAWKEQVHLYNGGHLVIFYMGEKPEIIQALDSLFFTKT